MTIDRRLLAGAVGLAIVLAACGGSAGSPASTGGAPTVAAPTSEPAPTSEDETEDSTAGIPGNAGMNDLAASLPEEAAGVTFQRAGFDGDQLGMFATLAGIDASELEPILREHDKTIDDVNFAIATPTSGGTTATVYALQVEGVDALDWMSSIDLDVADLEQQTMGGKTIYGQDMGAFGIWAYPTGDKVYVVLLGTRELAEAIISQLP